MSITDFNGSNYFMPSFIFVCSIIIVYILLNKYCSKFEKKVRYLFMFCIIIVVNISLILIAKNSAAQIDHKYFSDNMYSETLVEEIEEFEKDTPENIVKGSKLDMKFLNYNRNSLKDAKLALKFKNQEFIAIESVEIKFKLKSENKLKNKLINNFDFYQNNEEYVIIKNSGIYYSRYVEFKLSTLPIFLDAISNEDLNEKYSIYKGDFICFTFHFVDGSKEKLELRASNETVK